MSGLRRPWERSVPPRRGPARPFVRAVAVVVAVLAALVTLCGPAVAGPVRPAAAAAAAGESIGSAGLLTGTVTGALVSGSNDWWVVYAASPGAAVTVTVRSTAAENAPCAGIQAVLYNGDGTRGQLSSTGGISAGFAAQLAGRQLGADRYYVAVTTWGCASVAPYSLELTGGGGPALAPPSLHIQAGRSIGSASLPLQGGHSYGGTLNGNGGEDWYVLYKKADANLATLRVQDTTADTTIACGGITATLWGSTGTRDQVQSVSLPVNGAVTFAVPANEAGDAQGRYFVELVPWGCNTGGQTYTVEPEAAAEWTAPAAVPGGTPVAGTSIVSAWPPLAGGTLYGGTVDGAGTEDWLVLYKKQDSATATVRVQNTTVDGSAACGGITATLWGSAGTGNEVQSVSLATNGTVTFTVPGKEAGDAQGRYFLDLVPWGCNTGGQTYTVESESAAEWVVPARTPTAVARAAGSAATAWPPLPGGVASAQHLASGSGQDWYVLYKKADAATATVRVQNTTVNGSLPCGGITATLWGATSTQQLSSVSLPVNSTYAFVLPGQESASSVGRYYVEITPWGCNSLGQGYTIEPEAAGEFSAASRALPVGPSRAAAAGPLAGGTNYAAALSSATAQSWAYFHANSAASLLVQNTTTGTGSCRTVHVALAQTGYATLSAAPAPGAVAVLSVHAAGDYAVELTTGGCTPSPAIGVLLDLSGSIRGPVLSLSPTTLKAAALNKSYSAAVKASGGKAPYTYTAPSALPAGLTLNRTTGAITGKPTKAGSYTFMTAVADSTAPTHATLTVKISLKVS
ncbi:Ig domain-containing protein [Streptomyces polygonati]|uniref:Ig domain-containing protein n=1 Tax=Streptomyces polygonati TaxID=1617087 RepID=A0ABV8HZ09_9ACTN